MYRTIGISHLQEPTGLSPRADGLVSSSRRACLLEPTGLFSVDMGGLGVDLADSREYF